MRARSRSVLACSLFALACAGGASAGDGARLSLSLSGASELEVGQEVDVVVFRIAADGSSSDVSERASCTLSVPSAPGTLAGTRFRAERPGTTDVVCSFQRLEGRVGITVRGDREATIAQIQRGELGTGSRVVIEALVTATLPDDDRLDVWAQDQGGGEHSGIEVRDVRPRADDGTVPVLDLAIGDRVRVVGVTGERNGRTVLDAEAVERIGRGVAVTVDRVAARDLDPDVWDGCLVEVGAGEVVDWIDDYTFEFESEGARVIVDTLIHDARVTAGAPLTFVRGVVSPVLDDALGTVATILPRSASDLGGSGSTGGGDRITVRDVRDGTVAQGTVVTIADAVVHTLDPRGGGVLDLFVRDAAGGPLSGVQARDDRDTPVDVTVREGDRVRLVGEVSTRGGAIVVYWTELTVTGTAAVVPDVVTLEDLATDAARWYGGLVEVRNVQVDVPDETYGFRVVSTGGGAASLLIGDALVGAFDDVRTRDEYRVIRGALYLGADGLELWPRRAADLERR